MRKPQKIVESSAPQKSGNKSDVESDDSSTGTSPPSKKNRSSSHTTPTSSKVDASNISSPPQVVEDSDVKGRTIVLVRSKYVRVSIFMLLLHVIYSFMLRSYVNNSCYGLMLPIYVIV